MTKLSELIKTKRYYILSILLVLIIAALLLNQNQTPAIPTNIDDVTGSGARLEGDDSVITTQMETLENMTPYQNAFFKIETTDSVPVFKVTLFKGYEESKNNFSDWLLSNGLDKLSMSQFDFVIEQ